MMDVYNFTIQFYWNMFSYFSFKSMLQLRQGVKCTSAHVHDSYSSCYNMLLLTVYISWLVTFRALEHLQ